MYYKKLIGEKTYLSPMTSEHYKEYTKWVNDADSYLGLIFSTSIIGEDAEKEVLERLSKNYSFAIIDKESNSPIGSCGLVSPDFFNKKVEVGIFIGNTDYHCKGYGTDAMKLLLDYAFNLLNMETVFLKVYEFNKQAIRSYEKVGFKHAGRIRGAKTLSGKKWDEIYMDILREEFESPYIAKVLDRKLNK